MDAEYTERLAGFGARLTGLRRPLLISHAKPDGDALGSLVGLYALLAPQSIAATAVVFDDLPDRYRWLNAGNRLKKLGGDLQKSDLDRFDSIIIVDTCTYNQLEPVADWLRSAQAPKYVVDHHQTRDDLADHYMIDDSAAATCLILYDLAMAYGWEISLPAAEALFVGIATDTGWFRHSNTDARALAAAADLVSRGVRPNPILERIYQSDREARVRLLGKALESLQLHHMAIASSQSGRCGEAAGESVREKPQHRIALMSLPAQVFGQVGAAPADTEDIVNEPMRIGSVVVSVLLVEQEGVIRVNLRSRAPSRPGDPDIDVSAIASSLGGGGHRRAAGVRLRISIDEARAQVLKAIREGSGHQSR